MIPVRITEGVDNLKKIQKFKEFMSLPIGKRKTLLRSGGRKVRRAARKKIEGNRNIDNSPMKERKNGNDKMFKSLGKRMLVTVASDGGSVAIDWGSAGKGNAGRVAREHQEGFTQVFTRADMKGIADKKKSKNTDNPKAPATRKQARALLAEGFKTRKKSGKKGKTKWVRPTQKWIMSHLNVDQAGLILSEMRINSPVEEWSIQLASRTLLGATDTEVNAVLDDIILNMKKAKK